MDAKEAVARIGDRISLVGNVNNAQVLYQGTPDDVYKQARYAIEAGVNMIGPECAVPLDAPWKNIKELADKAKQAA